MAKKTAKTETEPVAFEDVLKTLESIVEKLESGQVPLDETIRSFEEGMKLAEQCHRQLNQAETKLKRLVRNRKGELETEETDFGGAEQE